jgi:glycosyltransferase involved in cell wall biosynthesis
MTISIILVSFTILVFYILLVILFITGWNKIPVFTENVKFTKIPVSVIVACKNEELYLDRLLNALKTQSQSDFELVLVNDHSTDSTRLIMESAKHDFENILIIDSFESGKKNAQKEGINNATGELIITTDADCEPTSTWIESIINYYLSTYNDLIIGPVIMKSENSIFSNLQKIEFASLVGAGAGALGVGKPIMCNGANLAFTKIIWQKCKNDLHDEEISGEDVFLLHSIKKRNGKIGFLKSEKAIVKTSTKESLKSFISQRKRWTSKSKKYTDKDIIITALIILLICVIEILLVPVSLFQSQYLELLLLVFGIKFAVDFVFLNQISKFFKLENLMIYSIILSFIYPFYIVYSAVSGIIEQNIKWK